jgi:FkbM family methyltransferase
MSLAESLRAMRHVVHDTRAFHRLGMPLLWYFNFHYRGRWHDRHSTNEPEETIALSYRNQIIRLPMTPVYSGALKGVFLDDEYAFDDVLPIPPRRILDLGANIGMAALALAAQFPKSEFILVEPDPRNIKRLRCTVEWNTLQGVIATCAVGPISERLMLRTGKNPTCSALQTSQMHKLPNTIEVAVRTVEDILAEFGWSRVDLVKVDIEGTEEALLTQNNGWLARTDALILEIHPSCSVTAIANAISHYGFELRRHGTGREPVYVATRKEACGLC